MKKNEDSSPKWKFKEPTNILKGVCLHWLLGPCGWKPQGTASQTREPVDDRRPRLRGRRKACGERVGEQWEAWVSGGGRGRAAEGVEERLGERRKVWVSTWVSGGRRG